MKLPNQIAGSKYPNLNTREGIKENNCDNVQKKIFQIDHLFPLFLFQNNLCNYFTGWFEQYLTENYFLIEIKAFCTSKIDILIKIFSSKSCIYTFGSFVRKETDFYYFSFTLLCFF